MSNNIIICIICSVICICDWWIQNYKSTEIVVVNWLFVGRAEKHHSEGGTGNGAGVLYVVNVNIVSKYTIIQLENVV